MSKKRTNPGKAGEPSHSGAMMPLTRREFIVGSAVALATGTTSAQGAVPSFAMVIEDDEEHVGRLKYTVLKVQAATLESLAVFREALFGEIARIEKSDIVPFDESAPTGWELAVRGVRLLSDHGGEDRSFDLRLTIDARQPESAKALAIEAHGWAFGGIYQGLGSCSLKDWTDGKPLLVAGGGGLAQKLWQATVGDFVTLPKGAVAQLSLQPSLEPGPGEKRKAVGWTLSAANGRASINLDGGAISSVGTLALRRGETPAGFAERENSSRVAEPYCLVVDLPDLDVPAAPVVLGTMEAKASRSTVAATLQKASGRELDRICRVALLPSRMTGGPIERIQLDFHPAATLRVMSVFDQGKAKAPLSLEEGPFETSDGTVSLWQDMPAPGRSLAASFAVAAKEVDVWTGFGSLCIGTPVDEQVEALPRSGAPVVISARAGVLTGFEINALMHSCGLPLKTTRDERPDPHPKAPRAFASRMDFPGGTDVRFSIAGLGEGSRGTASAVLLGYMPPNAAPAVTDAAPFVLSLDRSALRLTRWHDLMALRFRFSGVDLVSDGANARIVPRGPAVVAGPALVTDAGDIALSVGRAATGARGSVDPRPVMVVDFAPQHVAEQAFFTRDKMLKLPSIALSKVQKEKLSEHLATLRTVSTGEAHLPADEQRARAKSRAEARTAIQKEMLEPAEVPHSDVTQTARAEFAELCIWFGDKAKHPTSFGETTAEQRIYLGPEWLDPPARRRAVAFFETEKTGNTGKTGKRLPDGLPVDPVDAAEREAIRRDARQKYGLPAEVAASATEDARVVKHVGDEVLKRQRLRDPLFPAFKELYDKSAPASSSGWGAGLPEGITSYAGGDTLRAAVDHFAATKKDNERQAYFAFLEQTLEQADEQPGVSGVDLFTAFAESRLSGPSRLAFRINTDDPRRPGGGFDFTIEELTNWSGFDLAVVRRSEKLFKTERGVLPERGRRLLEDDLGLQLEQQGFTRSGSEGLLWRQEAVSADQRLAEAATLSAQPPGAFETSIEIPYRLMLSPAQDARFRTPRSLPAALLDQAAAMETSRPVAQPLWTATYDPVAAAGGLRAIWSPDFRPEAFLSRSGAYASPAPVESLPGATVQTVAAEAAGTAATATEPPLPLLRANMAPPRGPYMPWAISRDIALGKLGKEGDEVKEKLKVLAKHKLRTSLDAFDRHELVALSSMHGLPVMGRRKLDGGRVGSSQSEPPHGFALGGLALTRTDNGELLDLNDIYLPRPLAADELALSALGGFLNLDATFEPPAAALDRNHNPLFDALSIERWRHRIVLGRDISAEVVYKGYLYPLGIRAALIKQTERRFFASPSGRLGRPVAYLVQRMFLRIANPVKAFPAFRQPDNGRRFPVREVRLLTTRTPDLVDPFERGTSGADTVWPSGEIDLGRNVVEGGGPVPGSAFWPRTARRSGAEVAFEVLLDDATKIRMPLVFVDNVVANNKNSLAALARYYNARKDGAGSKSVVALNGAPHRYAPEERPGDTSFETVSWWFGVEGQRIGKPDSGNYEPLVANANYASDAFMQGLDQPPFYPHLRSADIRVAQMERLSGQPMAPVSVFYDARYALGGFEAGSDTKARHIFLNLKDARPLAFGNGGDRAGGVARPEAKIIALSRSRGPVGGQDSVHTDAHKNTGSGKLPSVADEIAKVTQLGEFFDGSAKILGVVSLKEILAWANIDFEPKLKEIREYGAGIAGQGLDILRQTLLVPLKGLLDDFDKTIEALEFAGEKGTDALAVAYPDVKTAFDDFRKRLNAAVLPGGTASEDDILVLSGLYEDGRRLVSALERVADDPVTPVKEAMRQSFDTLAGELSAKISADFKAIVDELKSIQADLGREIAKLVAEQIVKPARHLVLSIGIPVSDDAAKIIEAALDETLAYGAANPVWPDGKSFDPSQIGPVFAAALQRRLAETTGSTRRELEKVVRAKLYRAGLLNDELVTLAKSAERFRQAADQLSSGSPDEMLEGVVSTAAALAGLDDGVAALQQFSGTLRANCQAALDAVFGLLELIMQTMPKQADLACGADEKRPRVCTDGVSPLRDLQGKPWRLCAVLYHAVVGLDCLRIKLVEMAQSNPSTELGSQAALLANEIQRVTTEGGALADDIAAASEALAQARETLGARGAWVNKACSSPDMLLNTPVAETTRLLETQRLFVARLAGVEAWIGKLTSLLNGDVIRTQIQGANLLGDPATWQVSSIDEARRLIAGMAAYTIDAYLQALGGVSGLDAFYDDQFVNRRSELVAKLAALGTALGAAPQAVRDSLSAVSTVLTQADAQAGAAFTAIGKVRQQINTFTAAINPGEVRELTFPTVVPPLGDLRAVVMAHLLGNLEDYRAAVDAQAGRIEARFFGWMLRLVAGAGTARDVLAGKVAAPVILLAQKLSAAMATFQTRRDALLKQVGVAGGVSGAVLKAVSFKDMLVPATAEHPDLLKAQVEELATIAEMPTNAPQEQILAINAVRGIVNRWQSGKEPIAVVRILENVRDAGQQLLRGNVSALIDFDGLRRDLEQSLRQFIPSKVTLAYDFATPLRDEALDPLGVFIPKQKTELVLAARTAIDLLKPAPPTVEVRGSLGAFDVKLFGDAFDIVTLVFSGASYTSGASGGGKFQAALVDVKLGSMVSFLEDIQAYLAPKGTGPFVAPRPDLPGIQAGYTMAPMGFAVGACGFTNVSINASCLLPFSDGPALFEVALSRRDAPFTISYFPFGGSGHLALQATGDGIVGFEASFAFGGAAVFQFGPLKGEGRVMSGIFIRTLMIDTKKGTVVDGFFTAAGSANIACFGMCTSLTVAFGQQPNGSMRGSAVFVYSFSLGIKDIDFRIAVEREEKKGFGGAGSGNVQAASGNWNMPGPAVRYAALAANVSDATPCPEEPDTAVARLRSFAVCKGVSLGAYKAYFNTMKAEPPL